MSHGDLMMRLNEFPLLRALLERRSRRIGMGMTLKGGPLAYRRFPGATGPFRTVLAYQAHRLDPDFIGGSTGTRPGRLTHERHYSMASNYYEFVTHWREPGTVARVYDVLINGVEYTRWWPQVYLEVVETCAGGEHGLVRARVC